jgi:F-type H+-transporting ATPase subunit b
LRKPIMGKMKSALGAGLVYVAATAPALGAGLPQLDATKFSSQIIWLAISFAILYLLMSRMALPRIGAVLEERRYKIEDYLQKAETLKTNAEEAAEAYEKSLAEAQASAGEVIRNAREHSATKTAKLQAEEHARLAGEIEAAEGRISQAKEKAAAGIRAVSLEVAIAAAKKLAGETLDESAIGSAIDAAIEERYR